MMLALQLGISVWAAVAWSRLWLKPRRAALKWATASAACWFAVASATIAFLFDFDLVAF